MRPLPARPVPASRRAPACARLAPGPAICGSEVEGYLGHQANRTPPLVMGHELAGRVLAVGAGVAEAALAGADLVIDAVGAPETRGAAIRIVRAGGRVVIARARRR